MVSLKFIALPYVTILKLCTLLFKHNSPSNGTALKIKVVLCQSPKFSFSSFHEFFINKDGLMTCDLRPFQ